MHGRPWPLFLHLVVFSVPKIILGHWGVSWCLMFVPCANGGPGRGFQTQAWWQSFTEQGWLKALCPLGSLRGLFLQQSLSAGLLPAFTCGGRCPGARWNSASGGRRQGRGGGLGPWLLCVQNLPWRARCIQSMGYLPLFPVAENSPALGLKRLALILPWLCLWLLASCWLGLLQWKHGAP